MDTTQYTPTILSFCPGIRGIERGLERVFQSVRVAAYVEIESFIVENLLAGMEAGLVDAAPIWTNLKTFNPNPFRGRIDGIIGGYPCQPFSLAGERKGIEDPRHLWPYIQQSIAAIKPLWCYFENVSGHLSMGYPEVYRSLRDMGYSCEAGIYSAEEVGSSHERDRLFILAILGNTKGCYQFHDWVKTRRPKGKTRRSGSSEVADTGSTGLQRMQSGLEKRRGSGFSGSITQCRPQDYPLGQGIWQWDWEPKRTIESGLEYTINGYNFTADLHRAIGNSVVEQTAELAFLDLLGKHFP